MSLDTLTLFLPALGTLVLISLLTSLVGVFVISKKISLIGESISHAVIPGLALAYLFQVHENSILLFLSALGFVLLYFICIYILETLYPDKKDSLFAVLQVGFLALGALGFQHSPIPIQLTDIFLGNIFSVSLQDFYLNAAITLVVLTVFFIYFKKFCLLFFDPIFFEVHRGAKTTVQFVFDVLLSSALILSIQSVGSLLALGFLVIPSIIALLFNLNLKNTLSAAFFISVITSAVGFFISYQWSLATGPSIIIVMFTLFLIFSFIKKLKLGF